MRPMLATPGALPTGPLWSYEVKWDGMRLLADVSTVGLRLTSRSGRDVTAHFPELAGLAGVAADVALDGEVVLLAGGAPSFVALSERFHRVPTGEQVAARPVVLMLFDVLRLYGVSLLDRPLAQRRATLERLALSGVPAVQLSPTWDDGEALWAATREQGLEGVVAKRRDSRYRPGSRSPDWVKVPHRHTQDCVVGGWRPERSAPSRIGGLLLGVPQRDGRLRFAGRVGSGVAGDVAQRTLRASLVAAEVSPFADPLAREDAVGARWCRPTAVVSISHVGRTEAGRLRHPVFAGLRADLEPADLEPADLPPES